MPDLMSRPQTSCGSTPAPSRDAFDVAALLARCMDDAPLAAGLIERFMSRLPGLVEELENLLANKQWTSAASKVHTLKGEAGSLGAVELHNAAALLEQSLRGGVQEAAAVRFEQVKKGVQACLRARVSALEQLGPGATGAPQCR